ncbi:MAG: hypothetical protein GY853_07185 [PVC group bacterium]|nr:hypothetical protein [PVC group bacterium]
MKNIIKIVLVCTVIPVFLCAYRTTDREENVTQKSEVPTTPIVEYETIPQNHQSPEELYLHYHLIIVTSLEEASTTLDDNQFWAYGMGTNAYHYLELLCELFSPEYQNKLTQISESIAAATAYLKKDNLTQIQKNRVKQKLKDTAKVLDREYSYAKIENWLQK